MNSDMPAVAGLGADVGLRRAPRGSCPRRAFVIHIFVPSQHVDAVGPRRGGAHRLQVGAAVGFGEREAAAQLGGREPRQEVRPLLVGAVAADELRHHQVRVDDAGERHPRRASRLDDPHVRATRRARGRRTPPGWSPRRGRTRRICSTIACGYSSACSSSSTLGTTSLASHRSSVSSSSSTAVSMAASSMVATAFLRMVVGPVSGRPRRVRAE